MGVCSVSVKHFEGVLELKSRGLVWGSFHSISAGLIGTGQFYGHLSNQDVPEVGLELVLHCAGDSCLVFTTVYGHGLWRCTPKLGSGVIRDSRCWKFNNTLHHR